MTSSTGRLVIIGGGVNGLVAAGMLARAGLRPLVLERRPVAGGTAVTEEFHPGFRASTVFSSSGPLLDSIVRALDLERHGFEPIRPAVRVFAPSAEGRPLLLHEDPARTASGLSVFSKKDAERFPVFHESLSRIGALLAPLLSMTPPRIDRPGGKDVLGFAKLGRKFRALPKRDAWRLLRWGPMAVADFAAEWFESEPLRAVIAARGIAGSFAGPWSAGTAANLLLGAAADSHSGGPAGFVRGGMGALSAALASSASAAGAEIRTDARVVSIRVRNGAATGVVLESGEEIEAGTVVSSADPKSTMLKLVDPGEQDPEFVANVTNYRSQGVVAMVHFALSALPEFRSLNGADPKAALSGRIHLGTEIDEIERAFDAAKYGDLSPRPLCEATIPTISDPSLAPAGAHVLSVRVQYAPYRLATGTWSERGAELPRVVGKIVAEHAPGFENRVLATRVLTPVDLEETFGLSGGHIFHGEHSLDQIFTMRPILGWGRYRTPVAGLYLCGSGTHPGGGLTGANGANAAREIVRDWKKRK
ncbi:MAG TPA: NAD(P)/FAD-dependent oxidoreductase [Thermoanaerobaculia bacterium]|nr:NAD(P)/FAD-dependent oxidoreductase [Thermoanaerobaculia bacterium]